MVMPAAPDAVNVLGLKVPFMVKRLLTTTFVLRVTVSPALMVER